MHIDMWNAYVLDLGLVALRNYFISFYFELFAIDSFSVCHLDMYLFLYFVILSLLMLCLSIWIWWQPRFCFAKLNFCFCLCSCICICIYGLTELNFSIYFKFHFISHGLLAQRAGIWPPPPSPSSFSLSVCLFCLWYLDSMLLQTTGDCSNSWSERQSSSYWLYSFNLSWVLIQKIRFLRNKSGVFFKPHVVSIILCQMSSWLYYRATCANFHILDIK